MAERDDTVRELARLTMAALAYDETTSVHAAERIAVRLGIGEDDDAGVVEDVLRRALGMATWHERDIRDEITAAESEAGSNDD